MAVPQNATECLVPEIHVDRMFGFARSTYGTWNGLRIVNYDVATRTYELEDGTKISKRTFDTPHWPVASSSTLKVPLFLRRDNRWRNRMLRMRDKWRQKQIARVSAVGIVFVYIWLLLIALATTGLLLNLLTRVVFG